MAPTCKLIGLHACHQEMVPLWWYSLDPWLISSCLTPLVPSCLSFYFHATPHHPRCYIWNHEILVLSPTYLTLLMIHLIHFPANDTVCFFFVAYLYFTVCAEHTSFWHSLADRSLGWRHSWAVTSRAVINTSRCHCCTLTLIPSGICPGVGSGSHGTSIFRILKSHTNVCSG